jgi:hypothetical protein
MSEKNVSKNVQLEASRLGMRLFRNNRGMFKTLDGKRNVRAGLEVTGASDLIGITTVTVTPDMVGQKIGVFTCVEVKNPKWRNPLLPHEKEQELFIAQIRGRGGIGFFINDAKKLKESVDKSNPMYNNKLNNKGQEKC